MASDVVLLFTHSGDEFVPDRVAEALGERGVEARRVNTDLFPTSVALVARDGVHSLRVDDRVIDAGSVRAVWWRKRWTPLLPEELEADQRAACVRESMAALRAFADCFHGVRQVNDPDSEDRAENKLRQLRVAREAGMVTPPTLVTNDPAAVREFYDAQGGDIVTKMLTPYSYGMGRGDFVYTSRVMPEDLDALEGLALCPMVFQGRVEKTVELRVAVVGERCFTGAVDARGSAKGETDWRRADAHETPWQRATVPEAVRAKLCATVRALGLSYGAADVIVTPAGEYVFLEVNPSGEWGMLEYFLGLPIGAAIADELLGVVP